MTGFTSIIGNQNNLRHFAMACSKGTLSHAYIISGPDGSGKKTLAEFVAAALLCDTVNEQKGTEAEESFLKPCELCPSCVKVLTDNHPDLIHVTHKKEKTISVDEIREQIVEDILVKPYYGPYKIYIVDDAHLMNVNAQNALLKTIEEPPAYGLIFLLTPNLDGLLETVRSRCMKIEMDRLADEEIMAVLTSGTVKLPDGEGGPAGGENGFGEKMKLNLRPPVSFARGNLGKAMEIAAGGAEAELIARTAELMKSLPKLDAAKINEKAKEIEEADTNEILSLLQTWFRDVLYMKATGTKENLYFAEENITIKRQADGISFENINEVFQMIEEAGAEMKANVKAEAAVEVMLLKIRDRLK